jgi:hypothetical protein
LGKYAWPAASKRVTDLSRAGELIVVSDHVRFDWGLSEGSFYYPAIRHVAGGSSGGVTHGQLSCAFADGHAKSLQHTQFWEVQSINSVQVGPATVYTHFWPYD